MTSDALNSPGGLQGEPATYPPQPWHLTGSLLVSAFRVPRAILPESFTTALPPHRTPLGLGGYALVGVAFASYAPGGVLEYNELLVSVPSLRAGRLRYSIPQIWVDSIASRAGARELWAIPKEMGVFNRIATPAGASTTMTIGDTAVASLTARFGSSLAPGMRKLALPIIQVEPGRRVLSHNRVTGRLTALATEWAFARNGPLGYLTGRRPLASFALHNASIVFGRDVRTS
jgi:hypothetical protein